MTVYALNTLLLVIDRLRSPSERFGKLLRKRDLSKIIRDAPFDFRGGWELLDWHLELCLDIVPRPSDSSPTTVVPPFDTDSGVWLSSCFSRSEFIEVSRGGHPDAPVIASILNKSIK